MNRRNLTSLGNSIRSVVAESIDTETKTNLISEGYINSLTEKARQTASQEMEEEGEDEEEMEDEEEGEEEEKPLSKKKSKMMKEEVELTEKAAPGYEDWASDPKVKSSFKKQYGNRWKEVMYAKSWKMSKMDEETELEEGMKRLRRLRTAHYLRGKGSRETSDVYDKELAKVSASRLRRGGAPKQTVRAFFTDKPTTAAADKAYGNFARKAMSKASAKGKKIFEDEQFDEAYQAKRMRVIRKAIAKKDGQGLKPEVADFMKRSFKKTTARSSRITGGKGAQAALMARAAKKHAAMKDKLAEALQLDEAGYKRLMRLKRAAYKAGQKGSTAHGKMMRSAAERETQVAAGMARRGGASPEAVKGGGSRIGKSGKYTQKAGALANQRDKALAKFRGKVLTSKNSSSIMGKDKSEKRKFQQAVDSHREKARSGDFGQDNQTAVRARSNYQKRFGRLKGK